MEKIIKENSQRIREFINSKGDSKFFWKLLLTGLLSNNSTTNIQIIFEINIALKLNKNKDLILDIIDFVLDYGSNDFINTFLINLDDIYHLNTNKGFKLDEKTDMKLNFLIQKWANKYGNTYPKFKEIYDKKKKKKIKFPSLDWKMDTYTKFITQEEILEIKQINEHLIKINNLDYSKSFNPNDIPDKENIIKQSQNKLEIDNKESEKIILPKSSDKNNQDIGHKNKSNNKSKNEIKKDNNDNPEQIENYIIENNNECNNRDTITDEENNQTPGKHNAGINIDNNIGFSTEFNTPKNIDNNQSIIINTDHSIKNSNFCLFDNKEILDFSDISKDITCNTNNRAKFSNPEDEESFNSKKIIANDKGINNVKEIFSKARDNVSNFDNNRRNLFKKNNCNNIYQNQPPELNLNNNIKSIDKNNQSIDVNKNCSKINDYNNNGLKNNNNNINNINNINNNINNSKGNINDINFVIGLDYMSDTNNNNSISNKFLQMRKSNSCIKNRRNYPNNDVYLNSMNNIEIYKNKIEKEIKKLNSWINEGFYSFHNTYSGNLKMGIENIKKEIIKCDQFINLYKKDIKNMEKANIAQNLKNNILQLISRYEQFIKDNININFTSRSIVDDNGNHSTYDINRNSAL